MNLRQRTMWFVCIVTTAIGLTATSTSVAASPSAVPKPVEMFEMYCYRTGANYDKTVSFAKAMELKRMSRDMEKALGPDVGGGKGYIINVDKKHHRMLVLGASPKDTCSVSALRYDPSMIIKSMRSNYHLSLLARNDTGLQINELYVPGGSGHSTKSIGIYGLVGIMKAKDGSVVTLSYISPKTAMRVISANHSGG